MWDLQTGKLLWMVKMKERVWSLAFSSNGRRLASGEADGTIRIWNTEKGGETLTLDGHTDTVFALAFSPDGRMLASGAGQSDRTVKLWRLPRRSGLEEGLDRLGILEESAAGPSAGLEEAGADQYLLAQP